MLFGWSQSKVNKQYLVTFHCTNFITCDLPCSIHGNICKHAIKVGWLCSGSMDSNQLQNHQSTTESYNDPPEISIEAISDLLEDAMDSRNVDVNVEEIEMAKEDLFGYLDLVRNSPPATLTKIEQLIALVKKLLDHANNIHIMDYEFKCGLGAFELSLKRKKSFLSPKKRRKRRQQNEIFEIDLNIMEDEDEPFEFEQLNK